ncbi:heme biosynthesis HemY N-terminal domain-containing protein [Vibrio hannami]|uniref:heme biosynthesis protein HemY n=1 Tax=Vibrio hannami TaxID=2717094 RepID=UPI00241085C5|nr:heme biosynthesis HemY N-terminal domain-containing protein [Vibrio hannami]MDG3086682.1 heme biosynthesis HemY N-terminal domain-containing protein [Vibrio hannami]
MIRSIFLFVVLGLGLFVGTQFSGQQGYVLISIANKTIEMSVTTLVVFVVALLAALFGLEYLIKKLLHASSTTWNWFSVRKMRRARRYTNEGIVKLLEGDWKGAEKKVTRWANHHDMPLLCYLIASEAAQEMGDNSKRERYLELAHQQDNSELAVQLTKARQYNRNGQYESAISVLSELKETYPNNTMVLSLLKTCYVKLGEWKPLLDMLHKLEKAGLVDAQEREELFLDGQCGLMEQLAQAKGSEGLLSHWNSALSKKERQNTRLVLCLSNQLMLRKADSEAFIIIRETLKKNKDDALVAILPELNLPDLHPVTVLLEGIIKKEPENAVAYSALAQLSVRAEKWSDAQAQFEKALSIRADVSDYAYLADVLEKQDMTQAANDVSRRALTLVST